MTKIAYEGNYKGRKIVKTNDPETWAVTHLDGTVCEYGSFNAAIGVIDFLEEYAS